MEKLEEKHMITEGLTLLSIGQPEMNNHVSEFSKTVSIAKKNLKQKLRKWQNMFWTIGFPIMMLFVYNLVFSDEEDLSGYSTFDVSFPGIIVYSTGCATITSAVMFAQAKKDKTLELMDSMPVNRKSIFLGALLSESMFMLIQITLVITIGIGVMDAKFDSIGVLLLGYVIAIVYGIGAIGLGILISSFVDSPESANGIAMMVHWPLMFASGSFFPFEGNVVYYTPHYYTKQVLLQYTVMGESLNSHLQSSSMIGWTATETSVALWGGMLIILLMAIGFILIGLFVFQKKTKL